MREIPMLNLPVSGRAVPGLACIALGVVWGALVFLLEAFAMGRNSAQHAETIALSDLMSWLGGGGLEWGLARAVIQGWMGLLLVIGLQGLLAIPLRGASRWSSALHRSQVILLAMFAVPALWLGLSWGLELVQLLTTGQLSAERLDEGWAAGEVLFPVWLGVVLIRRSHHTNSAVPTF